jgi:hypothetical protein
VVEATADGNTGNNSAQVTTQWQPDPECTPSYPLRSPRLVGTGIAAGRDFGWFCYRILDRSGSIAVGKWQYFSLREGREITLGEGRRPFVSITLTREQKDILGVSSIQVHENAADLFQEALNRLVTAERQYRQRNPGQRLILSYGGTVELRLMRTSNEVSYHSWGIAIDINSAECPQPSDPDCAGGRNRFLYEKVFGGWKWGGTWPRPYTDPMHFELPVRKE